MTKNKKLLSLTTIMLIICLALGAVVLTSMFNSNTDIQQPQNPSVNAVPTDYTPISESDVVKDGRVSATYSPQAYRDANYPDHTMVAVPDIIELKKELAVATATTYLYLTDNIEITATEDISLLGDFEGVFDGNGKTVTMSISAETNTWYSGGFVNTLSGAIINTTFDVVKYSNGVGNGSDSYHGVIAYQLAASAIIDNIYVDLIYSPTAVGVNTAGPYIWTKTMHTGGGVKAVYLSGIAGQALAGSTIRNSTVNNRAGNAGFYATTWISNGHSWYNGTTYTNTYVSAFIGKSEGATLSNISYTGSGATTVSADSGNKKENTAHIFGIVGNASESSVTINGLNYAYTGAFVNGSGIITGSSQQAMFVREGTLNISNIYVKDTVAYTSQNGMFNGSLKYPAVQYNADVELVDMAGANSIFKVTGNADSSPIWTISNNGAEVDGAHVDLYKLKAGETLYVKSPLNLGDVSGANATPTMYSVSKVNANVSTYTGYKADAANPLYNNSKIYDGETPIGQLSFGMETTIANNNFYTTTDTNVGTYQYNLDETLFTDGNVLFDTVNKIVFTSEEGFDRTMQFECTITPRPISLTVDPQNIVYGNTADTVTYTVSVDEGSLLPIATPNFAVTSILNGNVEYDTTAVAGTEYAVIGEIIMPDGNDNYDITLTDGILTVIKRDIAITSTIADSDYNNAPITQEYSYNDGVIVNGYDAILEVNVEWLKDGQALETAPTNAGTYTLRYTINDNGEPANYNNNVFEYAFTINQIAIDIEYSPSQAKWYNGGAELSADYTVSGITEEDTALINAATSIAYYTDAEHTQLSGTAMPNTYYAVVTFAGTENYVANDYDITFVVNTIDVTTEAVVERDFTYGEDVQVTDFTTVYVEISGNNGSLGELTPEDIFDFTTTMIDNGVGIMGNSVGSYEINVTVKEEYAAIITNSFAYEGTYEIIPADATITLSADDKTSHTALADIANIDFNSYFVSEGVNGETPEMVITYIDAQENEINEITEAGYYTIKASLNDSNYNAVTNTEYTFFVASEYQTYTDGDIKFELSLDKLTISTEKTKTFISVNGVDFISLEDQPLVIDITKPQAEYSFTVRMDIDYELSLEGIAPFAVTYSIKETDVLALINDFDLTNVKVSHLSTMERVFVYAELITEASEDFNTAYTALMTAYQSKIEAINSAINDVIDSAAGVKAQSKEV